ncbi:MAG: radical SAM protein [Candidatus Aenigmatarchaeota archaeon]
MRLFKIDSNSGIPLIGAICFGIIDRGTNLLQIRPSTLCSLSCIFCSTDLGPNSKTRVTDYMVELDYLLEWVKEVVKFKGANLQAHIDFGEPTLYPNLIELVQGLKEIKGIEIVSMESKNLHLNLRKIDELSEIGLDRINLSIDALDPELARKLAGTEEYDVTRIIELAEYIAKTNIKLLLAPVWVPGLNDQEIPKIIRFAKEIGAKLGIQKYEAHKFGRKPEGVKPISWWKFYRKLEEWEKQFNVKLRITPKDFGIEKRKMLPIIFEKGQKVRVEIKAPGWIRNEMIGVAKNRCISIVECQAEIGNEIKVEILENKHNLYVARKI